MNSMAPLLAITLALLCVTGCSHAWPADTSSGPHWLYIGTYTGRDSKGIYRARMDLSTGEIGPVELAAETKNPSFLTIDPSRRHLYAVGELNGGMVSAFALDHATGALTALNQQSSHGSGPCFVSVDPTNSDAMVANYNSGSVAIFPIASDGSLKAASSVRQHSGKGPDPKRQEGPHAHGIFTDPGNRFVLVPDLGLDKVMIYRFDPSAGILSLNNPGFAEVAPGAGPRHLAFSPDGKRLYVVSEMGNTVTAFNWDGIDGSAVGFQTISTLPDDFKGSSTSAEIAISRDGRFLYTSNRGHDSIAVFAVDPSTGQLSHRGFVPCGGKMPRFFTIDPTGRWMLVANQQSNNIVLFKVNPATGQLTRTETELKLFSPVCLAFTPLAK